MNKFYFMFTESAMVNLLLLSWIYTNKRFYTKSITQIAPSYYEMLKFPLYTGKRKNSCCCDASPPQYATCILRHLYLTHFAFCCLPICSGSIPSLCLLLNVAYYVITAFPWPLISSMLTPEWPQPREKLSPATPSNHTGQFNSALPGPGAHTFENKSVRDHCCK